LILFRTRGALVEGIFGGVVVETQTRKTVERRKAAVADSQPGSRRTSAGAVRKQASGKAVTKKVTVEKASAASLPPRPKKSKTAIEGKGVTGRKGTAGKTATTAHKNATKAGSAGSSSAKSGAKPVVAKSVAKPGIVKPVVAKSVVAKSVVGLPAREAPPSEGSGAMPAATASEEAVDAKGSKAADQVSAEASSGMEQIEQTVDLLISHQQIGIRSREFDDELSRWKHGNVVQGVVLHSDYVTFDPLAEGTFGANVYLRISDVFSMDSACMRGIVVPFRISGREKVVIWSIAEKFAVELDFKQDSYAVYFEACEGDEVFYKLTFVPSAEVVGAAYLKDDPWGGEKGKPLLSGSFE